MGVSQRPSAALIEAERDRLIDFVESATVGLHWVGADGTILWANTSDYEPFGYTADEYIGHNIAEFHCDAAALEDILGRLKRGERLEEHAARLRCKDGSQREVRITSSALLDADGNLVNTRCFTRDVTGEIAAGERLRILSEASQLLASSLDFQATLTSVAKLCVPHLADWCAVEIVVEDGTSQQLAVAHTDPQKVELARELRRQFPPDPAAARGVPQVLRTGVAEHMQDIPEELVLGMAQNEEHGRLLQALGLRSYIVVPIALRGRILGAITLVSAESGRRYGPREVVMAQELASRAAQAIENARLYGQAQRARQDAEDAAQRLVLLGKLSHAIATALDPDDALKRLADLVVTRLADYCIAYGLDGDGTIRRVAVAHADPTQRCLLEELDGAGPPRLEDAHGAGAVLRTGQPILATEIPAELLERASQNPQHLGVLKQLAPCSSLIVPLKARGRAIGAICLTATDRSGMRYQLPDLAFAEELANRAALLVDNARLYRQAQEATRARDEMLSIVSHDLRSPLTTIVMACELLDDDTDDRRTTTRASIRRSAEQMHRLLEDLLAVTRIDEGRLALQKEALDLSLLIGDALSLHGPVAETKGIRLEKRIGAGIKELHGDRDRLNQALCNLLSNALKFTPEGGVVSVTAKVEGSAILIVVGDSGPGIPDEELSHVFDRFWRADGTNKAGVGLGLAIAKGVMEAHGGDIRVRNRPGEGAEFTLVFPGR